MTDQTISVAVTLLGLTFIYRQVVIKQRKQQIKEALKLLEVEFAFRKKTLLEFLNQNQHLLPDELKKFQKRVKELKLSNFSLEKDSILRYLIEPLGIFDSQSKNAKFVKKNLKNVFAEMQEIQQEMKNTVEKAQDENEKTKKVWFPELVSSFGHAGKQEVDFEKTFYDLFDSLLKTLVSFLETRKKLKKFSDEEYDLLDYYRPLVTEVDGSDYWNSHLLKYDCL
ncbi:MAG: hypothetical protein NTZ44_02940 [Candidatus Nomurabacteria bacterium]|nr:hypothetical protein [Candidatus Nomurabacteria bacterium]